LPVVVTAGQRCCLDWSIPNRPIITPQLAYLMTDVLKYRAARWPSLGQGNPLESRPPAAVRAGRTPAGQSQWVIGYTPQRVAGVWLGYPAAAGGSAAVGNPSQELAEYLQSATTGLWSAIHQAAHNDLPAFEWTPPPGVSGMKVCDPSGLLPTPDCPNLVDEIFLSGSEPIQADSLYRAVQITRRTAWRPSSLLPNW
jgi:membrane carboxypeptidase/penicillin-binding protein